MENGKIKEREREWRKQGRGGGGAGGGGMKFDVKRAFQYPVDAVILSASPLSATSTNISIYTLC